MINHARTLLLNQSGGNTPYGGQPGDEYLPVSFRRVSPLPSYLLSVRKWLFSDSPDRVYANYVTRACLQLLHATELAEYVYALDPRTTYDLQSSDLFSAFGLRATKDSIYINGNELAENGRCHREWAISRTTGDTVTVVDLITMQQLQQACEFTNGLSNLLKLPNSSLQFRIDDNEDTNWHVYGYLRPAVNLADIAYMLRTTAEPDVSELFGVGTPLMRQEPFSTFRRLWLEHSELAYNLGGLLLAVIYRTEALRAR